MQLTSIVVYPIKSCRGIALEQAVVERRGLRHDRRFMIVEPSGLFVTQRAEPTLALVEVAIEGDTLRVLAPGRPSVTVPARPAPGDGESRRVRVWSSEVDALEIPALSALFSDYLARAVRCVHMPESTHRAVSPEHAQPGDIVSFADGFPLLVTSEASRADLARRAGVPLGMDRFRPNLVVSGAEPWAEDRWARLEIGGLWLRAPKPCGRCVMTTIDPATGVLGKEPLRTLATFRKVDGEVMFGINLVPELAGEATPLLRSGMPVTCEERAPAA